MNTTLPLGRSWSAPPESEEFTVLVRMHDGSEREESVWASSATNAACLARILLPGASVLSVWLNH